MKLVPIKASIGSSIHESFTLDLQGGNYKSFSVLKDLNISQNQRIIHIGRDLRRPNSENSCLKNSYF